MKVLIPTVIIYASSAFAEGPAQSYFPTHAIETREVRENIVKTNHGFTDITVRWRLVTRNLNNQTQVNVFPMAVIKNDGAVFQIPGKSLSLILKKGVSAAHLQSAFENLGLKEYQLRAQGSKTKRVTLEQKIAPGPGWLGFFDLKAVKIPLAQYRAFYECSSQDGVELSELHSTKEAHEAGLGLVALLKSGETVEKFVLSWVKENEPLVEMGPAGFKDGRYRWAVGSIRNVAFKASEKLSWPKINRDVREEALKNCFAGL